MAKILMVEDEKALQQMLGELFVSEGFEVAQAYDGEAGLNMARKENPNLILLDLRLPKKDGFEVLRELKADEKTKDIPVIVFTNLETAEDIDKALEAGATTYIVKANYGLEDIVKKVKETVASVTNLQKWIINN